MIVTAPTPASDLSLTARQTEILDYMQSFLAQHGFPATVRQIGEATGIKSPNGVSCHLAALIRKGKVRRVRVGVAIRYIPAFEPGFCPCCGRSVEVRDDG